MTKQRYMTQYSILHALNIDLTSCSWNHLNFSAFLAEPSVDWNLSRTQNPPTFWKKKTCPELAKKKCSETSLLFGCNVPTGMKIKQICRYMIYIYIHSLLLQNELQKLHSFQNVWRLTSKFHHKVSGIAIASVVACSSHKSYKCRYQRLNQVQILLSSNRRQPGNLVCQSQVWMAWRLDCLAKAKQVSTLRTPRLWNPRYVRYGFKIQKHVFDGFWFFCQFFLAKPAHVSWFQRWDLIWKSP